MKCFIKHLIKIDLKEIRIAPIVAIERPPITLFENLLFGKKIWDKTLIIISLQFDSIEVNKEEFFSLLINKQIIKPAQKKQLIKRELTKWNVEPNSSILFSEK